MRPPARCPVSPKHTDTCTHRFPRIVQAPVRATSAVRTRQPKLPRPRNFDDTASAIADSIDRPTGNAPHVQLRAATQPQIGADSADAFASRRKLPMFQLESR